MLLVLSLINGSQIKSFLNSKELKFNKSEIEKLLKFKSQRVARNRKIRL